MNSEFVHVGNEIFWFSTLVDGSLRVMLSKDDGSTWVRIHDFEITSSARACLAETVHFRNMDEPFGVNHDPGTCRLCDLLRAVAGDVK